jgi:hypothetical protein
VYRWLIDDGLCVSEIVQRLNRVELRTDLGRAWCRATVHQVLTNFIDEAVLPRPPRPTDRLDCGNERSNPRIFMLIGNAASAVW